VEINLAEKKPRAKTNGTKKYRITKKPDSDKDQKKSQVKRSKSPKKHVKEKPAVSRTAKTVPKKVQDRKKVQKVKPRPKKPVTAKATKKPVQKPKEPEPSTPNELKWMEEDPRDHLLSRFIYDSKDDVIGESIGVEGTQLIMKRGKYFYSVPLKKIKERENDLTLKGKVNKRQARRMGEAWRKRTLDPLYQKKKK
jgi:hypothetical protein